MEEMLSLTRTIGLGDCEKGSSWLRKGGGEPELTTDTSVNDVTGVSNPQPHGLPAAQDGFECGPTQ